MTGPDKSSSSEAPAKTTVSLAAAVALGVGGMMGAGLYTLLGVAGTSTGVLLPLAFLVAAIAAGFSVYSYSKLGAKFPSSGGAAEFMVRCYGNSVTAGGFNVFQYVAYLIATALYAAGFAEYGSAVLGQPSGGVTAKLLGVGVIAVFAAINIFSSKLVGRAETVIIAFELVILIVFVAVGAGKADPSLLTADGNGGLVGMLTGAGLLYVTYQGFGVVANASGQMARPRRELPRAMFAALGIVTIVYLVISTLVVLLVPLPQIVADSGHVLADAGQAALGRVGFLAIAAAALLATASAVNATVFAASNVAADVSKHQELSVALSRTVWRNTPIALLVSAVVSMLLVLLFPLAAVGQMTSLAFLVVYGAVSAGHLRVRSQTGARAFPLVAAVVINTALFALLLWDAIAAGSVATWATLIAALLLSFVFEAFYRSRVHVAGLAK